MKPFALLLTAALLLAGCVTDARGRRQFDPAAAARWLELGSQTLDTFATPPAPPAAAATTILRRPNGEWRWQEDGWTWCPDLRPLRAAAALRAPADLPASWQRTLYHEGTVIEPRVVLNGRSPQ